jgi:hypothetical protein
MREKARAAEAEATPVVAEAKAEGAVAAARAAAVVGDGYSAEGVDCALTASMVFVGITLR